ncbi:WD40 repeat-like protein [Obba rivulosa]|uniref:Pre-rRNA-processing protein IPI3 n=1 Tax=Obba rivulosa TaxID=1052685 RepID=A0A8E2ARS8_9APHY|nr:WD40 repeat-like protein [Obba rivulosa]
MQFHECILCATAPSTSNPGSGAISLHDIQTGTSLASFKQTSANVHCTAVVETQDGQGGLMLSAQPDKSIMNVYNFQKDQLALKIVLPEKLSAIAVDPRGNYCAGGTSQGRIYIWEIPSGIMYNAWDAHYRQISVLRFSHDGAALIAGSEDSGVSVWSVSRLTPSLCPYQCLFSSHMSVSRLLDDDLQNEMPTAYCTFTDHTLPVTDIICGIGSFPSCRVLTASIDHTVKLWDLASRSQLSTFQFPKPITCLAWDPTERLFFAASPDGSIHQVNLFRQREDKFGHAAMEAVGGAGANDVIRINDEDPQAAKKRLISAGDAVTAMAISLTGSVLLAGTAGGLVHTYDIASHQLLRTLAAHKGLLIAHLATMLRPPDLVGHINLSLTAASPNAERESVPVRPVVPFQRMRDPKTREAHEVAMLLPVRNKMQAFVEYSREELLRDHAFFVQPEGSDKVATGVSLQSRVSELEGEVAKLREQLGKAKGINDVMWDSVVQRLVAEAKEKEKEKGREKKAGQDDVEMEDADGNARRRKRGRT